MMVVTAALHAGRRRSGLGILLRRNQIALQVLGKLLEFGVELGAGNLSVTVGVEGGDDLVRRQTAGSAARAVALQRRSEEHTSELQSLMRISYAVLCLKKKNNNYYKHN